MAPMIYRSVQVENWRGIVAMDRHSGPRLAWLFCRFRPQRFWYFQVDENAA